MASVDHVVPHVAVDVDIGDVRKSLEQILPVIRPEWDLDNVKIEDKSDGYCNRNCRVSIDGRTDDDFLVRIINDKIPDLYDRNVNVMRYLERYSLCPPLLCTFSNGLCMKFIQGQPVMWSNQEIVRREPHWSDIGREMARYHQLGSVDDALSSGLQETSGVSDQLIDSIQMRVLNSNVLPEHVLRRLPAMAEIRSRRDAAFHRLAELGAEKTLLHMDVNPSNIILTENRDRGAVFVDYECCAIGPAVFDIAWFFAASLDISNPDLNSYPDDEQQEKFIRAYLEKRQELRDGAEPTNGAEYSAVSRMKFLIRIARLVMYIRIICASLIMVVISDKIQQAEVPAWQTDHWLPHSAWQFIKDNFDTVMNEEFDAGGRNDQE